MKIGHCNDRNKTVLSFPPQFHGCPVPALPCCSHLFSSVPAVSWPVFTPLCWPAAPSPALYGRPCSAPVARYTFPFPAERWPAEAQQCSPLLSSACDSGMKPESRADLAECFFWGGGHMTFGEGQMTFYLAWAELSKEVDSFHATP